MTNEIYQCKVCGNIVSLIHRGGGTLVCCDEEMNLMEEKTPGQEGKEKHVPVIEKTDKGVRVKVGSVEHPMEESHYIALIQLLKGDEVVIGKRLKPGDKPVAEFCIADTEGLRARELCNLHGLWVSD